MHEAGLLARGSDVRSAFPALASGIGKNLPLTVARAAPELIPPGDRTGFPFHPQDAEPHAGATLAAKPSPRNTPQPGSMTKSSARPSRLERPASPVAAFGPKSAIHRRKSGPSAASALAHSDGRQLMVELKHRTEKWNPVFGLFRCSIKNSDRPLCVRMNARRSSV